MVLLRLVVLQKAAAAYKFTMTRATDPMANDLLRGSNQTMLSISRLDILGLSS